MSTSYDKKSLHEFTLSNRCIIILCTNLQEKEFLFELLHERYIQLSLSVFEEFSGALARRGESTWATRTPLSYHNQHALSGRRCCRWDLVVNQFASHWFFWILPPTGWLLAFEPIDCLTDNFLTCESFCVSIYPSNHIPYVHVSMHLSISSSCKVI